MYLSSADTWFYSLLEADTSTVDKNVAKKSLNVYYEAQMLPEKGRQRTVYCYPSPKVEDSCARVVVSS